MPQAGHVVAGRYRLEQLLGTGGMGAVWEATQLSLSRRVAVKLVRPDAVHTEEIARRFTRETEVVSKLRHPNIVQVLDGGRADDGVLFLVMELIQGQTLRERLRKVVALPEPEALAVAEDIASALAAAHAEGVIHRDLKCENVMLERVVGQRERARVLDFGIARLLDNAKHEAEMAANEGLTPMGSVAGTPGYIAPEQLLGLAVDGRADLYALGAVLFEMLAGRAPFTGATSLELLMQHLSAPAPRLASLMRAEGRVISDGVDEVVASLLEKDPTKRPASAEALLTMLRPRGNTPGAITTRTDTGLVLARGNALLGRAAERADLEKALDDAGRGRGGLLLLVGEPGIGKTRLADAFAEAAASRGIEVFWGRAWEAGGAPAYYPWSLALDALVAAQPDVVTAAERPWLVDVIPSLALDASPASPSTRVLEPNDARFRLFAAVDAVLKRATQKQPIAIILDDLHAADAASLQLLLAVARGVRQRRIVVLGTYRDVEAQNADEIAAAIAALGREARTLHLRRLERAEVDLLVVAQAGRAVPTSVANAIWQATQGNPLFVDEVVRLLSSQNRLDHVEASALPIPLGVREAVRQRLGRIDPAARPALEAAAVVGVEPRVSLAAAVHGEQGASMDRAIAAGKRAGVLMTTGPDRVRFSHALYREELVRELEPARRHDLHARTAAALERDGGPSTEVAHHWLEAGHAHRSAAAAATQRAADDMIAKLAFEDACALVQRALDALGDDDKNDAVHRGALLALLGRAVMQTGDVKRAHELCLRAAAIARERGDAELLARAALGYGARVTEAVVEQQLVALLEEASTALGGTSPLRPRVLARLASAQQPSPTPMLPMAQARDAIQLARATGDKRTLLLTLHDAMGALMSFARPEERLVLNSELLALAQELEEPLIALRARIRCAFDGIEGFDFGVFRENASAYASAVEALGVPEGKWRAPLFAAIEAELEGRFHDAEKHMWSAERANALPFALAARRFAFLLLSERSEGLVAVGRDVGTHLRRSNFAPIELFVALAMARTGDDAGANALYDTLRSDASRARDPLLMLAPGPFAWFGELAALFRDRALCELLLPVHEQHHGTLVSMGAGAMAVDGATDRVRALILAALDRADEAVVVFDVVLERATSQGMLALLPRATTELAEILAARAKPGDRERARALLGDAQARAESMQMTLLLPRIVKARASVDRPVDRTE